jgi:hypothetical protein
MNLRFTILELRHNYKPQSSIRQVKALNFPFEDQNRAVNRTS